MENPNYKNTELATNYQLDISYTESDQFILTVGFERL